jgi:hypothetical protein
MPAITLNNALRITFYPDSTLEPSVQNCFPNEDGADEYTSITYEQAKQLIEGLQSFVQAVDTKKQQFLDANYQAAVKIAMNAGCL